MARYLQPEYWAIYGVAGVFAGSDSITLMPAASDRAEL
jgi:hypothetical protein